MLNTCLTHDFVCWVVLLYHIVSKQYSILNIVTVLPSFAIYTELLCRLMPHLVVLGHICIACKISNLPAYGQGGKVLSVW